MSINPPKEVAWRCAKLAISGGWWLVTLGGRLGPRCVVTLCYHGVLDEDAPSFARQMDWIRNRVIAPDGRRESRRPFAHPRVCVTFDDAFRNIGRNAVQVLRKHRIPAVVFAVSENAGRPPGWETRPDHPEASEPTMTVDELREIRDELIMIGSHTATHARLTDVTDRQLREELKGSRAALEHSLGGSTHLFAFPYGAAGPREIDAAREAGYTHVFTLDPGDRGDFVRGRYLMAPGAWFLEFVLTADGAYSWLVLARRLRDGLRGMARRLPREHATAGRSA